MPEPVDLTSPSLYINRELSLLEFQRRVLAPVMLFKFCAVTQAKVARQVNRAHIRGKTRYNLHRLPVRPKEA